MIWDSIFLMAVIDLTVISLVIYIYIIVLGRKYYPVLEELQSQHGLFYILLGLSFAGAFYLADLFTMFVLPFLHSPEVAMASMKHLHLNWSWLASLLGISCVVVGLSLLIARLLPRLHHMLKKAQAIELEFRALNAELEDRIAQRTQELTQSNQALAQEIEDRKNLEASLYQSQEIYRRLVENAPVVIYAYSNQRGSIYCSPQVQNFLGYSAEYLYLHPQLWHESIHPADLPRVDRVIEEFMAGQKDFEIEYRIKNSRGEWLTFLDLSVGRRYENDEIIIEGVAFDITLRKAYEDRLEYEAVHDPLTKLPNRKGLLKHLEQSLTEFQKNPSHSFAVLFIDIDRFKLVNDSLSHRVGDLLLLKITQRLRNAVQDAGLIARIGGDEFVVLLHTLQEPNQALAIAQRILETVQLSYNIEHFDLYTTASIGLTFSDERYQDANEILRDADNAMYKAKSQGRNRYCVFDHSMYEHAVRTLSLQNYLTRGLEKQEFELYYQPIVSLSTQTITGFETLVRWNHPKEGLIPPSDFIGLAEETGLILELGEWILGEACRQLQSWRDTYVAAAPLTVNVNLSGRQVQQQHLIAAIDAILERTQLPSSHLILEVTESMLVDSNTHILNFFNDLRERQIRICIDDFGTGYSSLAYLHRFSFDTLKIDKSFVQQDLQAKKQLKMLEAIVTVAHNLDMDIVAEGIETCPQLEQLRAMGCEKGQGYLLSRPLPVQGVEETFFTNPGALTIPSQCRS